jgi:hypothetical protein
MCVTDTTNRIDPTLDVRASTLRVRRVTADVITQRPSTVRDDQYDDQHRSGDDPIDDGYEDQKFDRIDAQEAERCATDGTPAGEDVEIGALRTDRENPLFVPGRPDRPTDSSRATGWPIG